MPLPPPHLSQVDPDAPTPKNPQFRSWLHMLVINIPANDVRPPGSGKQPCQTACTHAAARYQRQKLPFECRTAHFHSALSPLSSQSPVAMPTLLQCPSCHP